VIDLHLRSSYPLGAELCAESYIHDVVASEVGRLVAQRGIEDYAVFVATCVGDYLKECKAAFDDRLAYRDDGVVADASTTVS